MEETLIPIVGTVGLIGNFVTILVLRRPEMKSTFNQSLKALAAFEIIFLLLGKHKSLWATSIVKIGELRLSGEIGGVEISKKKPKYRRFRRKGPFSKRGGGGLENFG